MVCRPLLIPPTHPSPVARMYEMKKVALNPRCLGWAGCVRPAAAPSSVPSAINWAAACLRSGFVSVFHPPLNPPSSLSRPVVPRCRKRWRIRLLKQARRIYEDFVQANAPLEISANATVRAEIEKVSVLRPAVARCGRA